MKTWSGNLAASLVYTVIFYVLWFFSGPTKQLLLSAWKPYYSSKLGKWKKKRYQDICFMWCLCSAFYEKKNVETRINCLWIFFCFWHECMRVWTSSILIKFVLKYESVWMEYIFGFTLMQWSEHFIIFMPRILKMYKY